MRFRAGRRQQKEIDLVGATSQSFFLLSARRSHRARHGVRVAVLSLAALLLLPAFSAQRLLAQQASRASISRLMAQGRIEQAEQGLWSVLQKQPGQGWALTLLAEIRLRQKRPAEAEALFRKALALDPNDLHAFRGLGALYSALGDRTRALDAYSRVVAAKPSDLEVNQALAALYLEAGRHKEAIAAVQRIPAAARPPQLLPILAAAYFGAGEPSRVPPLFPVLLRNAGSAPAVLLDFVTVLLRNGYAADAAGLLARAKPLKPSPEYLQALSRVREAQGKQPEALELLSAALRMRPKSFDLLFESARLAAQLNRWKEMIDFLRRADQAQPNRPEVLLKLSLALLRTGQPARALAVARKLNALQPDDPDSLYVLSFALIENDLAEEALPLARKLAAARAGDAHGRLLVAIAEYKTGDMAAAKQDLQRCIESDPHSAEAHYYSALIARREGHIEAAQAELEEAVGTNPDYAVSQAELGTVYLQIGNPEKARAALEQAVKLAPAVSQYHYHLSLAYARLGQQDRARTEMEQYQTLRQSADEERKRRISGAPPPAKVSEP